MFEPDAAVLGWSVHILTGGASALGLAVYAGIGVAAGYVGSWFRGSDKTKKALAKDDAARDEVIKIIHAELGTKPQEPDYE